jgi:V-type H+-transporting ATPase proteolipid subunit
MLVCIPATCRKKRFVLVSIGLTYMLTNNGFRFDIGWFLLSISPYQWALTGIALAVSLSVSGAAL